MKRTPRRCTETRARRTRLVLGAGTVLSVIALVTTAHTKSSDQTSQAAAVAAPAAPRETLDEAMRLASELNYDAAIAAFEKVKAQHPEAIDGLDGLKMVVVYAEVGDAKKLDDLTRWLLDRYRTPKTATEAERAVKGYIVHRGSNDPTLLAEALKMTAYASDHAAADGEGQYQGFFDTSRGVAEYRMGHFAEAATWLSKTTDHPSLYVRSLSLPFYAMTERSLGNRTQAQALYARALTTAADLPTPGSPEYAIDWTDILISRMVLKEATAAFGQ